jgi:hypothetical protein
MQQALSIGARLASRERLAPSDLASALDAREKSHGYVPYYPTFAVDNMYPGTYYLQEVNSSFERVYVRKSPSAERKLGGPLLADDALSGGVSDMAIGSDNVGLDFSSSVTTHYTMPLKGSSPNSPYLSPRLKRSTTEVWASGRPNVKVVVTGVAAALPGRDNDVFHPGVDNIRRLINGDMCITPIPGDVKQEMLTKNVNLLIKNKDGSQVKKPVQTEQENIQFCATLGNFHLTYYGVPESIASTMDRAVQIAVAAGLEALKDARIVTGEGENLSGWVLPEHFQETTGVVYATSFPALDAAIGEVSKYFETKTVRGAHIPEIVAGLRTRLESAVGTLSSDSEKALKAIEELANEAAAALGPTKDYEYDRKFLFRVLVLGNAQLAQIIKARGPNMQTNAACAGKYAYY